MQQWFRIVAVWSVVLGGTATPVGAQSGGRFYAGAAIGGFRVSADEVDGSSIAASLLGGVAATPWLDVEVDLAFPTAPFTRTYGGDALSLSFAPHGASQDELERFGIWLRYDKRRDVTASLSGVAIFHPSRGRVKPGFLAGVTSQRVRSRTDFTPVRVGPRVDPANPYASPRTETDSRTMGALTLGAQLAIAATPHLYVVPDVRFDYGSIGDEINNALRSSVRVLWRF